MKALTDDEFLAFLDAEIAWRRSELHLLKTELREASKSPGSPRERALARSISLMVYAHWEGYVKTSFDKLSITLSRRKPLVSDLSESLVLNHLRHMLVRLDAGDSSASKELVALVRNSEYSSSMRLKLRKDELVRTRDNLRFEFFEEIIGNFGLDIGAFSLSKHFINSHLCDRRNVVAHGLGSFPSASAVEESIERVLALIQILKDLQGDLLVGKQYLYADLQG